MTYYAKWSALYTVTMVYGEGMENVSSTYTSGSEVTFGAGLSPDGTGLYIWFADEACTQPITTAIITGDMTVYGVKAADVTYGTYNFVNKNGALVSNNKGMGSSTAAMTITMLGSYSVTYNYDVSTESGWDKFSVEVTISGTSTTTVSGASGEDSGSKTATLAEGDSIYFAYKKDSSGNSGDDTVTLTLVIAPIA